MASGRELQLSLVLAGRVGPSLTNALRVANSRIINLVNNVQQKSSVFTGMSSKLSKLAGIAGATIAAGAAASGVALIALGKKGIELASDLQEVQNVVDVTFGQDSQKISQWSQTTLKAFGLSELQAKQYAGTMGAMLKSSGITGQGMVDMSTKLASLSGDLASFYNLDQETAWEKIRSGISGETEPLKQLGINMSVANMEAFALSKGIKTSYQDMDQAAQTALRYSYLMSATKDAQGDFSRTQGGFANQTRLLKTNFDQLTAKLATGFLPIITKLIQTSNNFMDKLMGDPQTLQSIQNVVMSIGDKIGSAFTSVQPIISEVSSEFFNFLMAMKPVSEEIINRLVPFGMFLYNNVFKPLLPYTSKLAGMVLPVINTALKILIPIVQNLINKIMPLIQAVLPPLIGLFEKVHNLLSALAPVIKWVSNLIVTYFVGGWSILVPIINNVMGIFGGLIDFLTGVFSGNWALAWQGIKDTFVNIFKGIANVILSPLNYVFNYMNTIIEGINTIAIPDWVPGIGGTSLNIPKLPVLALAKGATLMSPALALLAEGGYPETVVPHTNTPRSRALLATAAQGVGVGVGGNTYITFAPNINSNSSDIKSQLKDAYFEFETKIDNYFSEKRRIAYGN